MFLLYASYDRLHSMRNFSQIINAAVMVVVFTGLVGYFGNIRVKDFLPSSTIEPQESFSAKVAAFNASIDANAAESARNGRLETLDAKGFEQIALQSNERPTFIMIYASWCPYCKRMFGDLNQYAKEFQNIRFVMLSIDQTPEPVQRFVDAVAPLNMESYIIKDRKNYYEMSEFLRSAGLGYQGGISKNVGVPYNMVFYQQKAVAEMGGALETKPLHDFLQQISDGAKRND